MKRTALLIVGLICSAALAQESGAPPALYKSSAELEAALEEAVAAAASATGWSITISPGITIRRRTGAVNNYAIIHPHSMEIYRILEGSGTLVTGGILNEPLEPQTSDDLIRTGHGISGGLAREVSVGDVLVLQPGTPHWFRAVGEDGITYMESRVRVSTHPIQYQ